MKQNKRGRMGALWRSLEFLFDMVVVVVSLYIIVRIDELMVVHFKDALNASEGFPSTLLNPANWIPLMIYLLVTAMFFKLYQTSIINRKYRTTMQNVALALLFTNVFLILVAFVRGEKFILRNPSSTIFVIVIQLVIFAIYKFALYKVYMRFNNNYVLVIGPKAEADNFAKEFFINRNYYHKLKYLIYTDEVETLNQTLYDLIDCIDTVLITESVPVKLKDQLLDYVSFMTYKKVAIVPKKHEILTIDAKFDQIEDVLLLQVKDMHLSLEMRFVKRTMDILVSFVMLTIAAIPMLFVALIVKLQDGGPVFYKQERFKRGNKTFSILKFRSMTVKQTYADEQRLATKNDPRITKFGRFIRATRLDELPQLFNVLKGEMSLVGPRPYMKSVVDEAMTENPDFQYRSNVKPGITGLSHIYGRYDTSSKDRLRYDLYYVRKCSIWLDLKIILLTVLTIFNKEAGLGRGELSTFDDIAQSKGKTIKPITCEKINGIEIIDEAIVNNKK